MKKSSREHRLILQAATGILIIAALAVAAVALILRQSNDAGLSRDALHRSFAARADILDVHVLMQQAEAGQRGYLISDDPVFLRPYVRALAERQPGIDRLRKTFSDTPSLLAMVDRVDALSTEKMRHLTSVLENLETKGSEAAMQLVRTGEGREIMDRLGVQIDNLLAAVEAESVRQFAREERHASRFRQLVLALIAAIVATVVGVGSSVLLRLRQRLRIEADLRVERHRAYGLQRIAEAAGLASEFPVALADTLSALAQLLDARSGAAIWRVASLNAVEDRLLAWPPGDSAAPDPDDIWYQGRAIDVRPAGTGLQVHIPVWDFRTQIGAVLLQTDARATDADTLAILAESAALQLSHAAERQRILDSRSDALTRSKAIFDGAIDGILSVNERGDIDRINPAACILFGCSVHAIHGKHVSSVLPEIVEGEEGLNLSVEAREGIGRVIESIGVHAVSGQFPVDIALSEIQLFGRRAVVVSVRDATERKRTETMKSEFLSTVSHELRTPLTAISGSLRLLAGSAAGVLPAKALRLVEIAYNNTERLGRLVNDILDIGKIESGTIPLRMEAVLLDDLVTATTDLNQAYALRHGISLKLDVLDPGMQVLADADRLVQVLTNLLSNAIKFSGAGSAVRTVVSRHAGMARLTVVDAGPGIPVEFHPRLFDRFAQANAPGQRFKGGTGLGLSIVKQLVELQHGRIMFETSAQGTSFMVDIPLAQ